MPFLPDIAEDENGFFEAVEDYCTDGNYRRTRFQQAQRYQKRINELEAQLAAQQKGGFVTIPIERFERMRSGAQYLVRRAIALEAKKKNVLTFTQAVVLAGFIPSDLDPAQKESK